LKEQEEIELIDEQSVGAFIFIIALSIMLYLLHVKRVNEMDNHATNPGTKDLAFFNKLLVISVYLLFLSVSYSSYKESGNKLDGLALIASIIAVLPPIIMVIAFILAQDDGDTMHPLL